ncbi:MAG: hypothetical protein ABSE74_02630 [Methanoregula sp.]|jgi:hypothetical protein
MKSLVALMGIAVLVILFACAAGCTTTSSAPAATVPAATTSDASGTTSTSPAVGTAVSTTMTAAESGLDTTVSVHSNDYTCLNIPKALGVDYLNPGEKYTVWVTTPGSGTITPNLLVLNVNDNAKFGTVTPVWDAVQKTWTYEGIVPLVKLIDITSPQSETLTIKNQGWYFICIDDRKESGVSDAVYQVPVKVTRI